MAKYSNYIEKEPHGTSGFPIQFYHLEPSHLRYEMPLHWHPEIELIRVLDGRFELHLNKMNYTLQAGDLAVVNPGVLHRGTPNRECLYDCTVFKPEMLYSSGTSISRYIKPIVSQTCRIQEYFPGGTMPELTETVDRLSTLLSAKQPQFELSVYEMLYRLFILLYRADAIQPIDRKQGQQKQLTQLIHILEWIDEHYTQKISLETLAKNSGLNEKYLCRFFKEYTSYTPIDYINRLRVEKAADEMLTGHNSVTEVAFTNGFNDSAYFAKVFRQVKGISPSEWKAKEKKR